MQTELDTLDLDAVASEVLEELHRAKRPVLVFGFGVKMAGAESDARKLVEILNIPVCPTWGAIDVFPGCVGSFGTHGVRAANFAIQNSDYVLVIGSRLDTKATGSPASSFAPRAKLVMVDCDPAELDKMAQIGRGLYRAIEADAKEFLKMLGWHARNVVRTDSWNSWHERIKGWQKKYPVCPKEYEEEPGINPYVAVRELSSIVSADDIIVSDTGCSLVWMMQGYPFKGERFIHAFNQTPMGYGLPAAIGAAMATGRRVFLVTGDGGLSLSLAELATLSKHKLSVKIVLFDNKGHAMCRQTQRMWLDANYAGTGAGDLATPPFAAIAKAHGGIDVLGPAYVQAMGLQYVLGQLGRTNGPALLHLEISPDYGVIPQVRFGRSIEHSEPALPDAELKEAMECSFL